MKVSASGNGFTIVAHPGDAKTLLAFNLTKAKTKNLAGFSIHYKPGNKQGFYLLNMLTFKDPSKHAQDANEPVNSSKNVPFQKFRWLHVPGLFHQLDGVFMGEYTYTVTPRYFQNKKMLPLDESLSLSVKVKVNRFSKNGIELGFTRGFVQSQAFVRHFGKNANFKPQNGAFIFNTNDIAGTNDNGETYTYNDEYAWLGFTAREKIFAILNDAKDNPEKSLDIFAYDLYEPDMYNILLGLAKQGRVRMIIDNSALHHNKNGEKNEDMFEALFAAAAANGAEIKRGKFGSIAHSKIFILKKNGKAEKVLTGSTNFSVTGLYVNSNHVLVTSNKDLVKLYGNVFEEAWKNNVSKNFNASDFANKLIPFAPVSLADANVSFSPHVLPFAQDNLQSIADRVLKEEKINKKNGNVFFAVMGITVGTGPVYPTLRDIHENKSIFSYGISDAPGGIFLYKPSRKTGVLVTGKTGSAKLPPPFSKEPGLGLSHQVHHKFVVCGFNTKDPVVWLGSSNLAELPEQKNGDNLIVIRDEEIVTAFALEALALVDHFHFRNTHLSKTKTGKPKPKNLIESDAWSVDYYDENDLHFKDRLLFL